MLGDLVQKKINVGILFGGKSAEHEISIQSAKNVIEAIDRGKYNPVLIGIDKNGKWFLQENSHFLLGLGSNSRSLPNLTEKTDAVALVPQSQGKISKLEKPDFQMSLDVVFPILHGPFGEDGTVQGLLKLANIAFVGAGVLGSAIGMDKDVMKRLLREAKIPVAKFLVAHWGDRLSFKGVAGKLGTPFFVKPANLGSSVGISKVRTEREFKRAVDDAFQYDRKILIEAFIKGREIECSVLGNENPIASLPAEIITTHEFYSYEAKYLDENGACFEIPAKLPKRIVNRVQKLAIEAFEVLCCEGMARVDFFVRANGGVVVNELNTIPGFTAISMYPRMWQASGISYADLIDRLIQLALERFAKEQKLKTSYNEFPHQNG